jgi:hypothetical protein
MNGRLRDELLNESLFIDLDQARWLARVSADGQSLESQVAATRGG